MSMQYNKITLLKCMGKKMFDMEHIHTTTFYLRTHSCWSQQSLAPSVKFTLFCKTLILAHAVVEEISQQQHFSEIILRL
jgi:hypothetical protein